MRGGDGRKFDTVIFLSKVERSSCREDTPLTPSKKYIHEKETLTVMKKKSVSKQSLRLEVKKPTTKNIMIKIP